MSSECPYTLTTSMRLGIVLLILVMYQDMESLVYLYKSFSNISTFSKNIFFKKITNIQKNLFGEAE